MKIDAAMEKIIVTAKQYGYSDTMISAFAWEIREKLYEMEEVTDESVEELIEEIF